MTRLTREQLRQWREAAERATRAPWYARNRHLSLVPDNSGMGATLHTNHVGVFAEADDCAFAAAARTALPELLDEVERLRGLVKEACELGLSAENPKPTGDGCVSYYERLHAISSSVQP